MPASLAQSAAPAKSARVTADGRAGSRGRVSRPVVAVSPAAYADSGAGRTGASEGNGHAARLRGRAVTRARLRTGLGWDPRAIAALALLGFALALLIGWQTADETAPPAPRVFAGAPLSDDAPPAGLAGVIQTVTETPDGRDAVVQGPDGPVTVRIPSSADAQVLRPTPPADLVPGDWLVVGAVDDNVNTFVLQGAVAIAPAEVAP